MADFTAQPLRILDRIYRFTGGLRGLRQFDLAGQIIPVHDVSQQTERGVSSLWHFVVNQVHAGAGSLTSFLDPHDPVSGGYAVHGGYDPAERDIYLVDCYLQVTVGAGANFGGGYVYSRTASRYIGIGDPTGTPPARSIVGYASGGTLGAKSLLYGDFPASPIQLKPGESLALQSTETGGVGITVRNAAILALVPRGGHPPTSR